MTGDLQKTADATVATVIAIGGSVADYAVGYFARRLDGRHRPKRTEAWLWIRRAHVGAAVAPATIGCDPLADAARSHFPLPDAPTKATVSPRSKD